MRTRLARMTSAAIATALTISLAACGSDDNGGTQADLDAEPSGDLRVLCYDCSEADSSFRIAADIMEDTYDINVTVESTSFQQLTTNAQLLFQGGDAPDVALYNQGTATVGNLASTGVLTDVTDVATSYGWDEAIPPSMATISRYDPTTGIMSNDGNWYGVSFNGEYAGIVYYNTDLFNEHDVELPTSLQELEEAMQTFIDAGVPPLATEGAETATQHIWYQLALSQVTDRQWVDDYQLYENEVDWSGPELTYAAETFDEWVKAGFIPSTSAGLNAEEMVTSFLSGNYPMMISGSWWFNRLNNDASFEWTVERFPGADFTLGATGKLLVVPESARNKTAAYAYMDIMLQNDEVQALVASNGALAYNPPDGAIDDPMVEQFQGVFDSLLEDDAIALYPDWPSPGMFDQLNSSLQGLVNQNITPEEALEQMSTEYESGRAQLGL